MGRFIELRESRANKHGSSGHGQASGMRWHRGGSGTAVPGAQEEKKPQQVALTAS